MVRKDCFGYDARCEVRKKAPLHGIKQSVL